MTPALLLRALALLTTLFVSFATHAADDKGGYGFAVTVAVAGIFDHTLKSVVVKSVDPGLPAAAAGLAAGDILLEVEGKPVPGSKAEDMMAQMKRKPGEPLNLKLKRANGDIYSATLVADKP